MISAATTAPVSNGTSVGAPSRVALDRANSTLKGVDTPRFLSAFTSTASICSRGSSISEPNASIPILATRRVSLREPLTALRLTRQPLAVKSCAPLLLLVWNIARQETVVFRRLVRSCSALLLPTVRMSSRFRRQKGPRNRRSLRHTPALHGSKAKRPFQSDDRDAGFPTLPTLRSVQHG